MNHDDGEDISAFLIDEHVKGQPTNIVDEHFINIDDHCTDELYASQEVLGLNDAAFTAIEFEEPVSRQMHDPFCTEMRRVVVSGRCWHSKSKTMACSFDKLELVSKSLYPTYL